MTSPTESSMAAEDYDDGEEFYDAHSTNEVTFLRGTVKQRL